MTIRGAVGKSTQAGNLSLRAPDSRPIRHVHCPYAHARSGVDSV
jgi:hypothetical protein